MDRVTAVGIEDSSKVVRQAQGRLPGCPDGARDMEASQGDRAENACIEDAPSLGDRRRMRQHERHLERDRRSADGRHQRAHLAQVAADEDEHNQRRRRRFLLTRATSVAGARIPRPA